MSAVPVIRPISELKNTNSISTLCHDLGEPVFITKNGYSDLVIMSVAAYEQKMLLLETYTKLLEAESQWEAGVQPVDGKAVFSKLRGKYGTNAVEI